ERGQEGGLARGRRPRQQALLGQALEADERGRAGEGRQRAVGRVAVAGRAQRQHLPPALAGLSEKIGEAPGPAPQFALVSRAGEAGRMEEQASAPLAEPRESHPEILGTPPTNGQCEEGPAGGVASRRPGRSSISWRPSSSASQWRGPGETSP